MLKTTDNLTAYSLAAGEAFILSVQVRDNNSNAVINMSQRPLVLSFFNNGTRALVDSIEGSWTSDGSGGFYRFARAGTFSEKLFGQQIVVELAERQKDSRSQMAVGGLSIASSANGLGSFGALIGRTETRVTVYLDAAGIPRVWEQAQLAFGASVTLPPEFTTPTAISSDGTPQVGEQLTGIDGVASDTSTYTRRWLLGSQVLTTTSKTYTPLVAGDYTYEVTATGPGGSKISASTITVAAATAAPQPSLSLSAAVTVTEGNSGTTALAWTLFLNRDGSTDSFPFTWGVTGTGTNPVNAADFGGTFPSGSGTLAPGETSKTIIVLATGDASVESTETLLLTVAANGLGSVTSVGTITNDDADAPTPANTRANSTQVRANNSAFAAQLRALEQQITAKGA